MAQNTKKITLTIEAEVDRYQAMLWQDSVGTSVRSVPYPSRLLDVEVEDLHTGWPYRDPSSLFDQEDEWVDKYGTVHKIDDMSLDYVANVLAYLNKDEYLAIECGGPHWRNSRLVAKLKRRLRDAANGAGSPKYCRPNR